MTGQMRLDKYLGEMGMGTRGQPKEAAKKGQILVNREVEKKVERKVMPRNDVVPFDGQPVSYVEMEYYMLNKPQGVVSATEDKCHRTVVELVGDRKRDDLFPMGRLDTDTGGLLLITDDGNLARRLLSPKRHVDRMYFARIEGELLADTGERLAWGTTLTDSAPTLPARLEIQKQDGGGPGILLTIRERGFHQMKRMFEALGRQVVYLRRMSMGPLVLDGELQSEEYRALSEEELEALKNIQMTGSAKTGRQDNRKERHHVR